ncbi:MAG: AMP-binding protein [Jatrophihabitans sp.]|uniref:AMP-binding protein n=1 Tax=Jatrophihabitans sp. TaxID=1932789 RepID=UPI003F7D9ECB
MLVPDECPPITVAGRTLSGEALLIASASVAEQVRGARAVAIEAAATIDTVVAVVGCLVAGVPAVPVPPDAGPLERAHILRDAAVDLVLGADLSASAGPAGARPPLPHGSALILYTSGTTGLPKGVPLIADAIAACLDGLQDAWQWGPDDVLCHGLPLFHVHGLVLGVLGALRAGSALVHTGRPTASAYAAAAADGATLLFGVPTVWGRVAGDADAARALASARLLVSGSAGLPRPVFDALVAQTGQGPVERYGMTETLITLAARADEPREPGIVGRPIAGVATRLDADGGLEVRGPTVFGGYLGRADAPFTDDGWFRTGDTAEVDAAGRFRIVGRTSTDLIKSGGYRIGAGEVETALLGHPAVREAAVVGVPDDDLGQRVVAFVVADPITPTALIDHVASELSVHKRPREVRFVDTLPRNALGKVIKTRLV